MKRLLLLAAAVVLIVVPRLSLFVSRLESTPVEKPTGKYLEAVEPVVGLVAVSTDRKRLQAFYAAFAAVVERDSAVIGTTTHLRTAHGRAGKLCFQGTGLRGKYPKLADAVDAAMAKVLGDDRVVLDAGKRADAVKVLRGIAWAMGEDCDA